MPYFSVDNLRISPIDFFFNCSNAEKQELANIISQNKIASEAIGSTDDRGYDAEIYRKSIQKLFNNRHRLSVEDEETINKIANKI